MSLKQLVSSALAGVIFVIVSLLIVVPVGAQGVNDFVVENFDAQYQITNDDPQGSLKVTESIQVDYSGQNRGILRAIPNVYKSNNINLVIDSVSRDGKSEPYISYAENDNLVLRIGDPVVYITGKHTYEIKYTAENVISFYDDYDELYWDVNGDQWLQPFTFVSATVRSEAPLSSVNEPVCFTGSNGSSDQNCTVQNQSSTIVYKTTKPLGSGQTLTFVQGFNKGYFSAPNWMERNWGLIVASPIFLIQLLIVFTSYSQWKKYGKDYNNRGAIAPYFERPKGLSVMQAGYISENGLESKHASASIIDLAIRGYIKIIETDEKKKTNHELELTRIPDDYVTEDEKSLLVGLFSNLEIGQTMKIESQANKLYEIIQKIAKEIDDKTIIAGYYELSPKNAFKKQIPQLIFALILFVVGVVFANFTNGVSIATSILMMVLVVTFMLLMTKRSVKGNMIVDHMKGLKLYLSKAEKDRMKMQDAVAAPLARNAKQPLRNRDFFEKLLPYAVAMGVEKSWVKAFQDIYEQPPDWYQGNWSTFNTAVLVSSISNTVSAAGTSFTPPSSSGSSGFSAGGGFSGGGGGGGGGGGW